MLLERQSGQDDICIGYPVTHRTGPETQGIIGLFVNTLVLRTKVRQAISFVELLREVRRTVLASSEFQDLPFDKLVDVLKPDRSLHHSPLFQVMMVFQEGHDGAFEIPGLTLETLDRTDQSAMFDLTLKWFRSRVTLKAELEYDCELFDRSTVQGMADHLAALLHAVSAQPHAPLRHLHSWVRTSTAHPSPRWNETFAPTPMPATLHELFEAQVSRAPHAIAATLEDAHLSYEELNAKADKVAHALRRQGVRADDIVGVCMNRSLELVIGILGVLKAGGAYMPLDLDTPRDRLAHMMNQSRVRHVVVHSAHARLFAERPVTLLALDQFDWQHARGSLAGPVSHAANLAYCIYTSGSTGRPKGVMNHHAGVVNRLLWMRDAYAFDRRDVVLQKTPFTFDVSVWEFFLPLITGGRLVLAAPDGHKDASYLDMAIRRESVTTVHFVPSMLHAFLAALPNASSGQGLRHVFCSGEALPPALQNAFLVRYPGVDLHNLYGPTEAAVDVCHWACQAE